MSNHFAGRGRRYNQQSMGVVVLLLLVGVAGCGRIGFDDCAWSAPARVAELSSAGNDFTGLLAPDGLSIYVASADTGDLEIYVATRPDMGSSFGAPTHLDILQSPGNDSRASVTGDGLELYFTSDRAGPLQLYVSRRASTSDSWGPPTVLSDLCPQGCTGPYVSPDGLRLYYNTTVVHEQWGTLMMSTRTDRTAAFAGGTPVPGLDRSPGRGFATLSADERTILFEQYDEQTASTTLYQSTRRTTQAAFIAAVPVPGIGDACCESDPALRSDGLELYFASSSDGQSDLYVTSRMCR